MTNIQHIGNNYLEVSVGNSRKDAYMFTVPEFVKSIDTISEFVGCDLATVAFVIHVGDKYRSYSGYTRQISVTIGVHNLELFTSLTNEFEQLLHWMTKDTWTILFVQKQSPVETQFSLFNQTKTTTVSLWSGGLDALTGASITYYNSNNSTSFKVLSGNNPINTKYAKDLHEGYERLSAKSTYLTYEPMHSEYLGNSRKPINNYCRSRGFAYVIIGSLFAKYMDCNKLNVYENGVGAINYWQDVISSSMSVHPYTLNCLSKILSKVFDNEFTVENPFLFSTKSEMIRKSKLPLELLLKSWSCDSVLRIKGQERRQCGYCSSCLLRRISLHAVYGEEYHEEFTPPKDSETKLRQYLNSIENLTELGDKPIKKGLARKDIFAFAESAWHEESSNSDFYERIRLMYKTFIHECETAMPYILANLNTQVKEYEHYIKSSH